MIKLLPYLSLIEDINKRIVEYYGDQGFWIIAIDVILVVTLFIGVAYILLKFVNRSFVLWSVGIVVLLYFLITVLGLKLLGTIFPTAVLLYCMTSVIYFTPNIRTTIEGMLKRRSTKAFINNIESQEELIATLLRSVDYLASRRIGAIITIEKEDSLTSFFAKGTMVESVISYELLSTIFMPGTALHDGAVVIRGNRIMCAGVFYQPSDRNDIPKNYGSRHRAAIGIAEDSDAFTIVVSEETGKIAVTFDSQLTPEVSLEGLRTFLKQNIIIK